MPLIAVLAGCGAASHTATTRLPDRAGPLRTTYVVSAPVLKVHGLQEACDAILTSYPPAGCSGVAVRGYDFAHLPGVIRYGGIGWRTPMLRLTGRWNGHVLVVSRVASTHTGHAPPGAPAGCPAVPRPRGEALARRIVHDESAGMPLIAFGPCGGTVWVLVPVANRSTIRAIRRRYGARVIVRGWLRRHTS